MDRVAFLLFDSAVKSVLIVALAGLACVALRHASAASRHAVWRTSMFALFVLPCLSVLLPGCVLPVLPPVSTPDFVTVSTQKLGLGQAITPVHASQNAAVTLSLADKISQTHFAETPIPREAPIASSSKFAAIFGHLTIPRLLLAVWALGAIFYLGRTLVSVIGAGRLARRCHPMPNCDALSDGVQLLAISRNVTLRVGSKGHMPRVPMTCGMRNPIILLPHTFLEWPSGRVRSVILHELAHVRRGDWLTLVVSQIVCSLYWWNPLVWMVDKRLRLESEKSCDDLVLGTGVVGVDYAAHLLAVARDLLTREPQVATVAMAQKSEIAERLTAILDGRVARRDLRVQDRVLCFVLLLGASGLAAMHLVSRSTPEPDNAVGALSEAAINSDAPLNLQLVQTLATDADVNSFAFTPNGSQLLVGSQQRARLGVWNVTTGKRVADRSLTSPLVAITYSTDGRLVSTAYANGDLRLSDSQTGRVLHQVHLPGQKIDTLQFSPDGLTVACGTSSQVTLVDTQTGALRSDKYRGIFRKIQKDRQGMGFTVAAQTSRLVLWNPSVVLWSPRWRRPTIALDVKAETCAASGQLLAVKSGNEIQIWDTVSRELLGSVALGSESHTVAPHLAFSPDGKYLAFGGVGQIKIWRLQPLASV